MIVIRMTRDTKGAANAMGTKTSFYQSGTRYDMAEPWQIDLARVFVREGWAVVLSGEFPADVEAETVVPGSPRHRTAAPEPVRRHAGEPEIKPEDMENMGGSDVAAEAVDQHDAASEHNARLLKDAGAAPENKALGVPENKAVRPKHVGHGKWCHVDADDERVDERLFDSEAEAEAALA